MTIHFEGILFHVYQLRPTINVEHRLMYEYDRIKNLPIYNINENKFT